MAGKVWNLRHKAISREPRYLQSPQTLSQTQHSLTHIHTKPSNSFTFYTKAISFSDSLHKSPLSIPVSLPSCSFFSGFIRNNHATRSIQRAPHLAAHAWLGWIPQGSQRTPHLEAQEIARRMHPDTITNNQIIWMLGLQRGPTSEHP